MMSILSKLKNKLERIIDENLIPHIVQWQDYWQSKIRRYKHKKLKEKLKFCAEGVRFKKDLKIDHPENVSLGYKVYIAIPNES